MIPLWDHIMGGSDYKLDVHEDVDVVQIFIIINYGTISWTFMLPTNDTCNGNN